MYYVLSEAATKTGPGSTTDEKFDTTAESYRRVTPTLLTPPISRSARFFCEAWHQDLHFCVENDAVTSPQLTSPGKKFGRYSGSGYVSPPNEALEGCLGLLGSPFRKRSGFRGECHCGDKISASGTHGSIPWLFIV